MKKIFVGVLIAAIILTLSVGTVFAVSDQIPSAKAAFTTDNVYAATVDKAHSETEWFDIMATQIKTGDPKDVVIDVSAETFLGTSAKLSGSAGSDALAEVMIRVLVDGVEAAPGPVTFDNRMLALEGDLNHYVTFTGEGEITIDPHWIEVFIDTASAHSFNFAAQDLGSGIHDIVVQAKLKTVENGLKGGASAAIGKISVVVDEAMFKNVN